MRCTGDFLDAESYALVKHLKFDFSSVKEMSSVQRHAFLALYAAEVKVQKDAIEERKNKGYRR